MTPEEILKTEFSEAFIKGMKERMLVSYFKYGPVAKGFPHKVHALGSMEERIRLYHETGNTENLMDAANFLMIEFMFPRHPDAHFTATDSDKSPGRLVKGQFTQANNEEAGKSYISPLNKFREK